MPVRIRRRIERLEAELLPLPNPGPPEIMRVNFVDSEKKVVSTLEFEMGDVRPSKRSWSIAPGKWGW